MAKTINYPLTKTVLSAEGSAEVLGRGTNEYTDLWSTGLSAIGGNLNDTWSLWDNFPTVVRFGNFVYCWHKIVSNHSYYILIDVVADPDTDTELGSNIAYKELSNGQIDAVSNVLISPDVITASATDGPYTPLTIGNKIVATLSGPGASFISDDRSIDQLTPVFTNGTISDILIGCNEPLIANMPAIKGYGDHAVLNHTDETITAYGTFAPFATKEQFTAIYGKESDWVLRPHNSADIWLFDNSANTLYNVAYANGTTDLSYPFTVEAMVPNTLYRDVAGDTTGDGIDNTPSFETALTAFAIVAAVVPALDPTKCVGFPGDIKIPGIATDGISERLNDAKAAVAAAASSTGLLDIEKRLEGLKARIKDSMPKGAQIQNLAADIANVNPKDLDAIGALNKKWKGAVDKVAGYFDDIGGLDICSLVGLEGKTGDDGILVKKPETPSIPESDIEEPEQSVYVPTQSKNTAQNEVQAATGITPAKCEKAYSDWSDLWTELRNDDAYIWANYLRKGPEKLDKLTEVFKGADYVKAQEAMAQKVPIPLTQARIDEMRTEVLELGLFVIAYKKMEGWVNHFQMYMQQNIGNAGHDFFPATDYDVSSIVTFGPDLIPAVGSIHSGQNFLNISFMDQANYDLLLKFEEQIYSAVKKYFFTEEGVNIQLIRMVSSYRISNAPTKQRIIDALNEGSEGDPADDSINGTPTDEFKNAVTGNVSYSSDYSGKKRNQPIQPRLMKILEASAAEKNYSIVVFSGGQDYKGKGSKRTGSIRHDGGYAADMRVYNDKGRRIHAASSSSKDIDALREFVLVLLKNGITSIGADDDYMSGNLHVDIASNSPAACWGAKGKSYRRIYAPQWLTSAFDNRV